MRVPGLPIRECARGYNNCVHMRAQMSSIDVIKDTIWAFVFGSRNGHIWALSQLSLCTHNSDYLYYNYFSISVKFSSQNGPRFCVHHDSPSHLAESRYPRSVEDETRNAEWNGNRNPEWWGDFIQLQIQIKQKCQFEFVQQDTSEFKSNQNLNSTLYRETPRSRFWLVD